MAFSYKPDQIYNIVNSAVAMGIGASPITAIDTSTLVSVGDNVLSTATNKEAFFKALSDRISETVCDVDAYVSKKRAIFKRTHDFGNALQMITYEFGESSIDRGWAGVNSWDGTTRGTQASPFNNAPNSTAKEYIFSDFCAYEYDDVIPDFQLKTAFTNADAMATFISGLYLIKANKLAFDTEVLGNLAVATAMYKCYLKANAQSNANVNLCENVLAHYNLDVLGLECTLDDDGDIEYPTGWVTRAMALKDAGFLKYLAQYTSQRVKQFKDYTRAFNIDGHTTFCNNPAIEINTFVANAVKYNLEADTYHNDLVKLAGDNYNEISYWMASGNYDFADTSSIMIDDNGDIKMDGIVGFIYDEESVMVTVEGYRSHSLYNPKDEVLNTYDKASIKYAVVPFKDMCVLQIADPITEGTDTVTINYLEHGYAYEVE